MAWLPVEALLKPGCVKATGVESSIDISPSEGFEMCSSVRVSGGLPGKGILQSISFKFTHEDRGVRGGVFFMQTTSNKSLR